MGEVAQDMLDGTRDPETGVFNFNGSDGPGFPVASPEADALRLAARDALAAEMFPERWARVANVQGKRAGKMRHTLRRQAEVQLKLNALRAEGRSCATCRAFGKSPVGMKERVCDAHSDFHGYAITTADGLCVDWSERRP